MRADSLDLRDRVLRDSDAGSVAEAVAEKNHVSPAWVRRLKQRRRETGEVAPRAQRYGPHPMLPPQLTTLMALIQAQPNRTLVELKDALGTQASPASIWRARARRRSTGRTSWRRARPSTFRVSQARPQPVEPPCYL